MCAPTKHLILPLCEGELHATIAIAAGSAPVLGLAAATGAPALLLICGCCGLVEPSRQPSDGSEPSADHSRYELEPQDQVAGGRWLLHVGGSRGLLPGLESATAKISGSGRSGVPPNMST